MKNLANNLDNTINHNADSSKNNTVASKLLREAKVNGLALYEGSVDGLKNLPKDIPQIAASIGVGGVMGVVAKTGTLGELGVAAAGTYMVSSWLYNEYKNNWHTLAKAESNVWNNNSQASENVTNIKNTLGNFLGQGLIYGTFGGLGFKAGADAIAPKLGIVDKFNIGDFFHNSVKVPSFVNVADTSLAGDSALLLKAQELANPPKSYEGLESLTKMQRDKLIASDTKGVELKVNLQKQLQELKNNESQQAQLVKQINDAKAQLDMTNRFEPQYTRYQNAKLASAKYAANELELTNLNTQLNDIDSQLKFSDRSKLKPNELAQYKELTSEDKQKLIESREVLARQIDEMKLKVNQENSQSIQRELNLKESEYKQAQLDAPQKSQMLNQHIDSLTHENAQLVEQAKGIKENIHSLVSSLELRVKEIQDNPEAINPVKKPEIIKPVKKAVEPKVVQEVAKPVKVVESTKTDNIAQKPASIESKAIQPEKIVSKELAKEPASKTLSPIESLKVRANNEIKALTDQKTAKFVVHQAQDKLAELEKNGGAEKAIQLAKAQLEKAQKVEGVFGKPKLLDALNSTVDYAKSIQSQDNITDSQIAEINKMCLRINKNMIDQTKLSNFDTNEAKLNYIIRQVDRQLNTDIFRVPAFNQLADGVENGTIPATAKAFVLDKNGQIMTWKDNQGAEYPMLIDLSRMANNGYGRDGSWLGRFRPKLKEVGSIIVRDAKYDENGKAIEQNNPRNGKSFVPTYITQGFGDLPSWLQEELKSNPMPYNQFLKKLN